jgi:hypothetical protein
MTERRLRLVPADSRATSIAHHPSSQPPLAPATETVFEWHGLVEHELAETPCCHEKIEVTNLVTDDAGVTNDVVAMLSTVLHGWDGYDVMVLVTVTPPTLRCSERPL